MYEEAKGRYSKHLDFIILDFLMIQITFLVAYALRQERFWAYGEKEYLYYGIALGGLDLLLVFFAQPYKDILKRGHLKELRATIVHISYLVLLSVLYIFLSGVSKNFSRFILLGIWVGGIITLFISREILKCWVRRHITTQKDVRFITIFSTVSEIKKVMATIKSDMYRNYRINQVILLDKKFDQKEIMGVPVSLFNIKTTMGYLKKHVVDEVFIDLPREVEIPEGLLEGCYQMGITVHMKLVHRPYEVGTKTIEEFAGCMVLTSGMKIAKPYQIFLKRCLDIFGGLLGTLITGILVLIIGPIIYFKDPGPIFFSQTRIGKNGRHFKIYKFRSMYMNAEERKQELLAQNEMQGLMFKMEHDPRIIPGIGEKIRAWSLDEFPQFINVLKGEMSLIGTRPPTVDEWEQYEAHHCKRLAIKPGITGMWQVSGRSDITDFEEVVALDTEYITDWSLGLDIKILFKTIWVVLGKSGSR